MRWVVPVVIATLGSGASAAPRLTPQAEIGELALGVGSWLVTTAPAEAAYSFGRAQLLTGVAGTYRMTLTWRRIDADIATLEIWLPDDSVVLVRDGGIALFKDNASFAGFAPVAGIRTQASSKVELVQLATTLELRIDGVKVQHWSQPVAPAAGRIAVGLKAPPRRRARVRIIDVSIAQGQ